MGWFSRKCPVGDEAQSWIEESMLWFRDQFGDGPLSAEIVLPTADFFFDGYARTADDAHRMLALLCEYTEVDPELVMLDLADFDADTSIGAEFAHYHQEDGKTVISVDGFHAADPVRLIARITHELCHVRLLGEERITAEHPHHEPLTDLLSIYLGLGICTANASLEDLGIEFNTYRRKLYHLGHLGEATYGYGLACYAWLRGEGWPGWMDYLDGSPRATMRDGLRYLEKVAEPGQLTSA